MENLLNLTKPFDGTTDPHEFARSFKSQSLMLNWNDAKQLTVLQLLLKGKALRVYNNLATKENIDDVIKAVTDGCA